MAKHTKQREGIHFNTATSVDYISGEQFDYRWSNEQIKTVKRMYQNGYDIRDMSDTVRKTKFGDVEVFILLADLICRDKLQQRECWIYGNKTSEP